jgi:hemerythrin superfamily protein
MDALTLLAEQHQEVDQLVAALEAGTEDAEAIFAELADKLAAHATIEEKIFYPACKAKATEDLLLESVEEHLAIKRVLADMLELSPDDDQFEAKLAVLKETLEHHAHEEEEGELFPAVRKLFSADELEGLAGEMLALFEELLPTEPRKNVPAETEEAAPI